MHFVFSGSSFPRAEQRSKDEERAALRYFCRLEERRMQLLLDQVGSHDLILIDRTIETLVAHTAGLGQWDKAFRDECWELVENSTAGCPRPDLTIHLRASASAIQARAPGRAVMPPLFTATRFIDGFNLYFSTERRAKWPYVDVDADMDPAAVADACYKALSV
jgi:thymidylate kinase